MNRELSLLEFQKRVLEEARDAQNKLLERVKFVSIVSSNLDEFFMVRVAALKQKLEKGSAGSEHRRQDGRAAAGGGARRASTTSWCRHLRLLSEVNCCRLSRSKAS